MSDIRIGVIGGSGLYSMDGLEVAEEREISTPFGSPSDPYVLGELEGQKVAFLARHGNGHRILPSELNYRANIYGFKTLGVEWIVSVSAVGSMKIEYQPTDIVVPDQFFDRTRHRADTFFGNGLVAHVSLARPICPSLQEIFCSGAGAAGARVHSGGTYICMEGPQFSTRAESEICYATLAMVTDYDCWHEEEEDVSGEAVMEVVRQNAAMAQDVVRRVIRRLPIERDCGCGAALASSLITERHLIPEQTLEDLDPIIGKYMAGEEG